MKVNKVIALMVTHFEYVLMSVTAFYVVYGNYLFLAKGENKLITKTEVISFISVLVLSLLISTIRHYADDLNIAIKRYVSIGLVFPIVVAVFVPINTVLTGTNRDNVFWSWVGCFFAGTVICLASLAIGLLLRIIVKVLRSIIIKDKSVANNK